jgi:hypothetical protein
MGKIEARFRSMASRCPAFLILSGGPTLKDGAGPAGRHNTHEYKSAPAEQPSILGLGPLASPATNEPHIQELVRVRLVRRLRDAFDEQ